MLRLQSGMSSLLRGCASIPSRCCTSGSRTRKETVRMASTTGAPCPSLPLLHGDCGLHLTRPCSREVQTVSVKRQANDEFMTAGVECWRGWSVAVSVPRCFVTPRVQGPLRSLRGVASKGRAVVRVSRLDSAPSRLGVALRSE